VALRVPSLTVGLLTQIRVHTLFAALPPDVRKGSAFPNLPIPFWRLRLQMNLEAQASEKLSWVDRKARGFPRIRRQSGFKRFASLKVPSLTVGLLTLFDGVISKPRWPWSHTNNSIFADDSFSARFTP
jgi:hypothetical protein